MCTIHAEFAVHLVTIGYGNFLRRELLRELLRRELLSTAYIAQVIQADQDAQQASLGQGVQWELDWIQLELD
jgi:predicted TIM-barrel enzyme